MDRNDVDHSAESITASLTWKRDNLAKYVRQLHILHGLNLHLAYKSSQSPAHIVSSSRSPDFESAYKVWNRPEFSSCIEIGPLRRSSRSQKYCTSRAAIN